MIKLKKRFLLFGIGLLELSFSHLSLAKEEKLGSHGGQVISNGVRSAEVIISEKNSKVRVYLLREEKENPTGVLLTLFDQENHTLSFELKAIPQNNSPLLTYQGSLNSNQGQTPWSLPASSYFGIELKIPLSKGKPEILRFQAPNP